jgi:hypothetical protein
MRQNRDRAHALFAASIARCGLNAQDANDLQKCESLAQSGTFSSAIIRVDAQMAKLVDAPASGAGDGNIVEVRVFFWAPK